MTTSPPAPAGLAERVNDNITDLIGARFKPEYIATVLGVSPRALFEKRRKKSWKLSDLDKLAAAIDADPSVFSAPRS